MIHAILKPSQTISKAYLKEKPKAEPFGIFKTELARLLDSIDDLESEEHNKNHIAEFLKRGFYDDSGYAINTKGRADLVIHHGKSTADPVAVLIEAKSPSNKTEMVKTDKLNTKAFQELVLYFMRERVTAGNKAIKHLIITNGREWFIYDATVFESVFASNKQFVKKFEEFEKKELSGTKTDFFYNEIAKQAIENDLDREIPCVHIVLEEYQKAIAKGDDSKLIPLFKIFSPTHLLKLPVANDSNSLNRGFYSELLHIIGLGERTEKGKKLIERKALADRDSGSLLENAIARIQAKGLLYNIRNASEYGATQDEQLFSIGLELVIVWLNRILFLKLLEAQLIGYHGGDTSYRFLNNRTITDYDVLDALFFEVLARPVDDRADEMKQKFPTVPYLNSSLFEQSEIERSITLSMSGLKNDAVMNLLGATVLKENSGKKRTGTMDTLEYLFDFLDSFDFAGETNEDLVQSESKSLINASVLGLIFEKLNGYKPKIRSCILNFILTLYHL